MKIWGTGKIKGLQDNAEKEYKVIELNYDWIDKVANFQMQQYEKLEDKDLFEKSKYSEFEEICDGDGVLLGILIGEKLIGYRINSRNEEYVKYFSNMLGINEYDNVVYLDSMIVDESYRGNGLQKRMIKISLKDAWKNGKYRYAVSTASPKNIASLKSLLSNKVNIAIAKELYGGKKRFVCLYDTELNNIVYKERKRVLLTEYEHIKTILEKGYKGIDIIKENDDYYLELAR